MLSDAAIKRAKPRDKPWRLKDAHGLFLLINPNGSRWWRWDYRFGGKSKQLSFGVYGDDPDVSLADARAARDAARKELRAGVDPSQARKDKRAAQGLPVDKGVTFERVMDEWLEVRCKHKAAATLEKRNGIIDKYIRPTFAKQPIAGITGTGILALLRPIDATGRHETAAEVKRIIGQVLRYGIAIGTNDRDWTFDIREALTKPVVRHHAGLTDPVEIGKLLRAIDARQGASVSVTYALRLLPLVWVRPVELRTMEWAHIDEAAALWRIPADIMKRRRPHLVPLSKQARAILAELKPITGGGRYVFPSFRRGDKPMSDGGMNQALVDLGYPSSVQTPHGFRTMASTRAHELDENSDHIEMQLAHMTSGVRGVYNQAKYLPQRAAMLQRWADYLDQLKTQKPKKARKLP